MNKSPIDELNRLAMLSGTDEGFFILAIHSFIEGLANSIQSNFILYAGFNDVIDHLMGWLKERAFGLRIVDPVAFLSEAEETHHGH